MDKDWLQKSCQSTGCRHPRSLRRQPMGDKILSELQLRQYTLCSIFVSKGKHCYCFYRNIVSAVLFPWQYACQAPERGGRGENRVRAWSEGSSREVKRKAVIFLFLPLAHAHDFSLPFPSLAPATHAPSMRFKDRLKEIGNLQFPFTYSPSPRSSFHLLFLVVRRRMIEHFGITVSLLWTPRLSL